MCITYGGGGDGGGGECGRRETERVSKQSRI